MYTKCIKSVLIILGFTAAAYAVIHKKMFGFGRTTLMTSNKEMSHTMKIVQSLVESGLLIKDFNETIKKEAK